MSFTVHGLAVSQGIAIGHAHLVSHALLEVAHFTVAPKHVEAEVTRLHKAVTRVKAELAGLKAATGSGARPRSGRLRRHAHHVPRRPDAGRAAEQLIRTRRANAEWALVQQMEQLVEQFEAIEDAYLRERKSDVVQVVERVVKVLLGHPGTFRPSARTGSAPSSSPTTCRPPTPSASRITPSPASSPTSAAPPAHRHRRPQPVDPGRGRACATSAM
jgi:phosphotransferase system enzyme I (PtsI)